MLNTILIIFHLIVCFLLMVLILLHSGKDAGMGSITGFSFAAQASVMETQPDPLHDHHRSGVLHHHVPVGVEAPVSGAIARRRVSPAPLVVLSQCRHR